MAVQIPDPGTGNGQTGDNEYVFRKKVKDNFSDQTNAASRLVGTAAENVCLVKNASKAVHGDVDDKVTASAASSYNLNTRLAGDRLYAVYNVPNSPSLGASYIFTRTIATGQGGTTPFQIATPSFGATGLATRNSKTVSGGSIDADSWTAWSVYYGTHNTTKDSNGFLKAASPIVKVFADRVELNEDATDQDVTYKKNGIGDYTITTVSGLSTDGWYIELPKDMNGNPKVAVTLQETNGVISLKSYKRIFSMETFTFVPDLDQPLDIPDGRWIDLRLNEIPVEPSEPELEV